MNTTVRTAGLFAAAAAALTLAACNNNNADAPATPAEPTPETAPLNPSTTNGAETSDIVAAASTSPEFTTLTSAIQSADLQGRLSGPGPFTVFAPTNAAFEKIPAATRTSLMQPAQKADLSKILTYHVVPGRLTAADLQAQAAANNGVATLSTVQGGKLTARDAGNGQWEVTDAKGNKAKITLADQTRSNGVVHVIDTVLMP
ncbi:MULTISPECIES: fasciclin domain-containing protein [unclassified Brevundimonas]|uniref:fasciclin domain-containing protein n=1 Tax=unclassified Brevundimonas TaxID=2622653 RepID=UPI0025C6AF8B|nr:MULTISPECIES: fasciclin domain-containing protein [unclassified Brevundimonas]